MRGAVLALIALYRCVVSPLIPPRCRFYPVCSCYAEEAVRRFGIWRGGWMTLRRLSRCHPWSGRSGFDPVPAASDVSGTSQSKEKICGTA